MQSVFLIDAESLNTPEGRARVRMAVLFAACLLSANPLAAAIDEGIGDKPAAIVEELLPETDQLVFAEALEKAVADENPAGWNNLIDWNRLVDAVTAGDNNATVNRVRREFKNGFIKGQTKLGPGSWAHSIVEAKKRQATFKFLRLGKVGNEPYALFRMKMPQQGGVNYHQYFLKRSKDGLVRCYDIYIFLSAERISDTTRRAWAPLAADVSRTFLEKLAKPADPVAAAYMALPNIQVQLRDGKGESVLEFWRKLPEKAQREKVMLLIRLQAARLVANEEYSQAIDDFRKFHPNDAALDFLLIDSYVLKKDYDAALGCVNRTNENLGGDAWLISLRGLLLSQLGRFDEARDAVNESIRIEPDLDDAYWNAVAVSMNCKNFDDTVKYLNAIEERFELKIGDLTPIPEYADFVKSPQYSKWMESRK